MCEPAAFVQGVRLWPTTPMVLRQSTEETTWETGTLPAKADILIFVPFFHRDDERLADANRFAPELWLEARTAESWPLIPFSEGPAVCPGRNLVLLLSSAMLAEVLAQRHVRLQSPVRLNPDPVSPPGTPVDELPNGR